MNPVVKRVIIVHELDGNGSSENPFRRVMRIYTLAGEFLAETDPHAGQN